MTRRLQHLNTTFLLLFGAVAVALGYWIVLRGPTLLAREDNPRLVEAELRVQRGRILDRNSVVLAETVGEPGALERRYALPAASTPAVGYYSLRYGVAGVEATYDAVLRGRPANAWDDEWDALLHRHPTGQDVQLTLDANLQAAADAALGNHQGAVVLLAIGSARNAEVLAMVSHPGYNPNLLDEQFDALSADENAPLLNRATQALYQPGAALQPLLLAAGLEQGLVLLDAPVSELAAPVQASDVILTCATPPLESAPTLATALAHACPAPFAELGLALGPAALIDGLAAFGLFDSPELPLELALGTRPQSDGREAALVAEALGQGKLTVSPLQMAWALVAIANQGELPPLRLVLRIGSDTDGWKIVVPASQETGRSLSPQTAAAVTGAMLSAAGDDIAGHAGAAAAGPDDVWNSWFVGFAPAFAPRPMARYVVVVLLENTPNREMAAAIGTAILESLNSP